MTEQSEMWITVRAAARIIGCQLSHARRLAHTGAVNARQLDNGHWRIEYGSLMERYGKPDGWVTVSEAAANVPLGRAAIIKAIQAGHLETRRAVRWGGNLHLVNMKQVSQYANRENQVTVETKMRRAMEWLRKSGALDARPVPSQPELVQMAAADGVVVTEWAISEAMKAMGHDQMSNKATAIVRRWILAQRTQLGGMGCSEARAWFQRDTGITVKYCCFHKVFSEVRK
jgi:hypothetical protein